MQDDGIRNWPPLWLTYETPWDAYFESCLASMMKVQEARKVDAVVVEMQVRPRACQYAFPYARPM